jgi:hypothetical protein
MADAIIRVRRCFLTHLEWLRQERWKIPELSQMYNDAIPALAAQLTQATTLAELTDAVERSIPPVFQPVTGVATPGPFVDAGETIKERTPE